jgi:hypothetical protein
VNGFKIFLVNAFEQASTLSGVNPFSTTKSWRVASN